ncbi:hypothetical protein BJ944DRAFT_273631 [Cunninghamella echinulata]|nr:hypothetical protein BJ944DRAFT_273631 [Cunninghamella echinulata]
MLFQFKYIFYLLGLFLLLKTSCANTVGLSMCDADCPMQPNEGCHRTCSSEYTTCNENCEEKYSSNGDWIERGRCNEGCDKAIKECANKCPQEMNYADCKLKCHS